MSNKQFENEIKKTTSFTIAYLDINLTILKYKFNKIIQYMYTENCKTVFKKLKVLNKWKDVHGLEGLILLRWQYSQN